MTVKEEIKTIEQRVKVYVADDGKEFTTKQECEKYEREMDRAIYVVQANKLRIEKLDDQVPLTDGEYFSDVSVFRWYGLSNEKDFEIVNKAYGNSLDKPETFPEIICVESTGGEAFVGGVYTYTLSFCTELMEEFWKCFGIKVIFADMDVK